MGFDWCAEHEQDASDVVASDEDKCDGCGACVPDCAEGARQILEGKARLVSDVYCDNLGACLGICPKGALRVEKRVASTRGTRVAAHRCMVTEECESCL